LPRRADLLGRLVGATPLVEPVEDIGQLTARERREPEMNDEPEEHAGAPSLPAPVPPGGDRPRRGMAVRLGVVVGWTERQVRKELGKPNERRKGKYWASDKPGVSLTRSESGALEEIAVFGPVPQRIAPGTPYTEWVYHSVVPQGSSGQPQTWVLYFAAEGSSEERGVLRVIETYEYATGAVF